jgi:hypothetical protein
VVVQGYFAAEVRPNLTTEAGDIALSPGLVDSFLSAMAPGQYAQAAGSMQSPIGRVDDLKGEAFAVRADGTRVQLAKGDPVFEGDIVETGGGASAIRMMFVDKTMFALGSDARLALDKLVFDPSQLSGASQFSILKGVFIFSSGEIAKTDNTEMSVITPVAAIGIRGTEVAGRVDGANSQFTIIDGVIEVTTQAGSVTLDSAGETTLVSGIEAPPGEHLVLSAAEYGVTYSGVSSVAPPHFTIGGRAAGKATDDAGETGQSSPDDPDNAAKSEDSDPDGKQLASNITFDGAPDADTSDSILAGGMRVEHSFANPYLPATPYGGVEFSLESEFFVGPEDTASPSSSSEFNVETNAAPEMSLAVDPNVPPAPAPNFKLTLQDLTNSFVLDDPGPNSSVTVMASTMGLPGIDAGARIDVARDGGGNVQVALSGAAISIEEIKADISISNFVDAYIGLDNRGDSKITVDSVIRLDAQTGSGDDTVIFQGLEVDLSMFTFNGGLGVDTLQLSGSGQSFDLGSGIYDLTEVEHIDLSGGADALLKLGANIVSKLNGTGINELSLTDDTLVISGTAGDRVEFMNGVQWGQAATPQLINGESYSVFAHASGSQVMVHEDVATIV